MGQVTYKNAETFFALDVSITVYDRDDNEIDRGIISQYCDEYVVINNKVYHYDKYDIVTTSN